MKAYVITTGTIFGIVTVAHIWRIIAEDRSLATNPIFVGVTVVTAALCLWALAVIARANR